MPAGSDRTAILPKRAGALVTTVGPRSVAAARPLLFDRLEGHEAGIYDSEALLASIQRELSDLFNTRATADVEALARRRRSTIDYGIPDLSLHSASDVFTPAVLAEQLREGILAFEPRLAEPAVDVLPHATLPRRLIARISGVLPLERIRERVSFEINLGGGPESDHGA